MANITIDLPNLTGEPVKAGKGAASTNQGREQLIKRI